jgi:hypothetical protein
MKTYEARDIQTTRFGPVKIGIIVLALATAAIHFSLLFPDVLFILNALGYLTFLAAYFLPVPALRRNHVLIRWAFIGFTAITIIAWLILGDKSGPGATIGYITKAIEAALIILLWIDGRE